MPSIPYDASRAALLHPERRPTVFRAGAPLPSLDGICAEVARLAYLRFESDAAQKASLDAALAIVGLSAAVPVTARGTDTQAFATRFADGQRLIAFRGTEPDSVGDIGTDLLATLAEWPPGGRVHQGFARAFDSVRPVIDRWLRDHPGPAPIFTGHSLGAALATLAASHWAPARYITFGSPRVGNEAFADGLADADGTRYVNCCDIVTCVPPDGPWYRHVGPARYIDRTGVLRDDLAPAEIEADQLAARSEYLMQGTWIIGNVLMRDLADHAPINYVRALLD